MSAEVKVRLKGYVKPEEVLNFLQQKGDINPTARVHRQFYETDKSWYIDSGYILFNYKDFGDMYYYYSSEGRNENYDYWVEKGLKEMAETETTTLSMYSCKDNINLMRQIAAEFGGWIDENDCDEELFHEIVKSPDGTIKPVRYVTMQEVYEKFGEIVVIKD